MSREELIKKASKKPTLKTKSNAQVMKNVASLVDWALNLDLESPPRGVFLPGYI